MNLAELFGKVVELNASDLFLSVGAPPYVSIEGTMTPLGKEKLSSAWVKELSFSMISEEQSKEFSTKQELNVAVRLPGIGRFRINLFKQMGEVAFVARYIKAKIPSIEELKLPQVFKDLVMEERGLILVVGSTGTGKSTTLASMISHRNKLMSGHILTIEDPVEFVHEHERSLVNQREVGVDTESYEVALKNAMREAPNVIMIGEIRDQSTMKKAIAYAESGHLCLSTLHANSANEAIDRIINFFDDTAHKQLFNDLSGHLKAIICQRLPIGKHGKRIAAVEIMINTPLISNLIHRGEVSKIKEAMSKKKGEGCQTFDDSLFELVRQGTLEQDVALQHADSRNDLALRFRLEGTTEEKTDPIIKEINYAKGLVFAHYHTYSLLKYKVDKISGETDRVLENAIQKSMMQKGFNWESQNSNLELRYSLTLNQVGNNVNGVILMNISDVKSQKSIWRAKGSRALEAHNLTEWNLEQDVDELLKAFPPGE